MRDESTSLILRLDHGLGDKLLLDLRVSSGVRVLLLRRTTIRVEEGRLGVFALLLEGGERNTAFVSEWEIHLLLSEVFSYGYY